MYLGDTGNIGNHLKLLVTLVNIGNLGYPTVSIGSHWSPIVSIGNHWQPLVDLD